MTLEHCGLLIMKKTKTIMLQIQIQNMTGRWVGMKPYIFLTSHPLTWPVANRPSSIQRHKNLKIRPKSKQFVFCWSVWIKNFAYKTNISYLFVVGLILVLALSSKVSFAKTSYYRLVHPLHPVTWALINERGYIVVYASLSILGRR